MSSASPDGVAFTYRSCRPARALAARSAAPNAPMRSSMSVTANQRNRSRVLDTEFAKAHTDPAKIKPPRPHEDGPGGVADTCTEVPTMGKVPDTHCAWRAVLSPRVSSALKGDNMANSADTVTRRSNLGSVPRAGRRIGQSSWRGSNRQAAGFGAAPPCGAVDETRWPTRRSPVTANSHGGHPGRPLRLRGQHAGVPQQLAAHQRPPGANMTPATKPRLIEIGSESAGAMNRSVADCECGLAQHRRGKTNTSFRSTINCSRSRTCPRSKPWI